MFINKIIWHNNLKAGITMNVKISMFVKCVGAIMYLLLRNFYDFNFKEAGGSI